MFSYELTCRNCKWRTICGPDDALARVRLLGVLRRESEPEEAILETLFIDTAPRMTCPLCKEKALVATRSTDVDDDNWQAAVLCEICRRPIPAERLEAIPNAKRCAACQHKSETGTLDTEPDYCPQCGAPMETRVSRSGGITRYKSFCTNVPPCRT